MSSTLVTLAEVLGSAASNLSRTDSSSSNSSSRCGSATGNDEGVTTAAVTPLVLPRLHVRPQRRPYVTAMQPAALQATHPSPRAAAVALAMARDDVDSGSGSDADPLLLGTWPRALRAAADDDGLVRRLRQLRGVAADAAEPHASRPHTWWKRAAVATGGAVAAPLPLSPEQHSPVPCSPVQQSGAGDTAQDVRPALPPVKPRHHRTATAGRARGARASRPPANVCSSGGATTDDDVAAAAAPAAAAATPKKPKRSGRAAGSPAVSARLYQPPITTPLARLGHTRVTSAAGSHPATPHRRRPRTAEEAREIDALLRALSRFVFPTTTTATALSPSHAVERSSGPVAAQQQQQQQPRAPHPPSVA
ncbi:hypothetical protein NESM_000625800 [Novymonas esmeraldas]|uniref:Uncharacterized protein n=1 Tax=Novymonas esmeraldas TaxID=1808958 RepID=A0AAW0ERR1_9TRYP